MPLVLPRVPVLHDPHFLFSNGNCGGAHGGDALAQRLENNTSLTLCLSMVTVWR